MNITTSPSLGDRMKMYENVSSINLMRRTPVIIRIDGKCFSSYTKNFTKPYDEDIANIMIETTRHLMNNIQGAVLGFTQSDEISLFLRDYDKLNTDAWFGNNLQKIVSISAAMASTCFYHYVREKSDLEYFPIFDARAFSLPKEEVSNYFLLRQQDCIRNSVNLLGNHVIGHTAIQNLKTDQIKEILIKNEVDWNDMPAHYKYGSFFFNGNVSTEILRVNRDFINSLVYIKENA